MRVATVLAFNIYEDTNGLSIKFRAIVQNFLAEGYTVNLVIPTCDERLLPVHEKLNIVPAFSIPFWAHPNIQIPLCWNPFQLVYAEKTTLVTLVEFVHLSPYYLLEKIRTLGAVTIHASFCTNLSYYSQLQGFLAFMVYVSTMWVLNCLLLLHVVDHIFVAGTSSKEFFWPRNQPAVRVLNGVIARDFRHSVAYRDQPYRREEGPSELNLFYCTRLSREKNLRMLVDICAALRERVTPHITCTIVGEGSEYAAITAYIAQNNLGDRVKLVGFKTHSELKELYLTSKNALYCSTSVSETFGQNIIEAGLCGLPIFTNVNIETHNMFKHRENAYIFHSIDSCVQQIQEFTSLHPTERATLLKASTAVCHSFDMETNIKKYFSYT